MTTEIHTNATKTRYEYDRVTYVDPCPGLEDSDVVGHEHCGRCGGTGRMPYNLDGGRCWGDCGGRRDWSRPITAGAERVRAKADVERENRHRREDSKADFKWAVFVEQAEAAGYSAWSRALSSENEFVNSLVGKVRGGKLLSDKQISAGHEAILRDERWAAERVQRDAAKAELQPLAEGRRELTGTILKTDLRETSFGSTWKMMLQLDSGHRVWGTCPDSLFEGESTPPEAGAVVTLTARVEPAKDDASFAFLSRPTKARRLS